MPQSAKTIRRLILWSSVVIPVVIFIAWRLWLAHDVNHQLAVIRANGLPANGDELNKWYAAVPDSENAALVLTEAFALLRNYSDSRSNQVMDFKFPSQSHPLSPAEAKLLRGYVELNAAALKKSTEALNRRASRYPIDFSLLANTPLPHLAHLRTIARLNQYQAELAIQIGDGKNATRDIEEILHLASTLNTEPCLISQMVRIATIEMAVGTLERKINKEPLDSSEITNLVAMFAKVKTTNSMSRGLIGERAMGIPFFRMKPDEAARIALPAKEGEEKLLSGGRPFALRIIGFYERDLRYFLKSMETSIALVSFPPPKGLAADRNFALTGAKAKKHGFTVSGLALSSYSGVAAREAKFIAYLRLANLSLSIEQFRNQNRRLPETLDELALNFIAEVPEDPFDGMPLRYRRLQKGYLIYSIGKDRRDNEGLEEKNKKESPDKSSFDLTFIVER